jgi:hypothetical protein
LPNSRKWLNSIAAFTVAELGEMLPSRERLPFKNDTGEWVDDNRGVRENTEADARAKLLVLLLERNSIKGYADEGA